MQDRQTDFERIADSHEARNKIIQFSIDSETLGSCMKALTDLRDRERHLKALIKGSDSQDSNTSLQEELEEVAIDIANHKKRKKALEAKIDKAVAEGTNNTSTAT